MSPEEAVAAVHNGETVSCTREEYPAVRRALQDRLAKYIDWDDRVRTMITLQEVKRLDQVHGVALEAYQTLSHDS